MQNTFARLGKPMSRLMKIITSIVDILEIVNKIKDLLNGYILKALWRAF